MATFRPTNLFQGKTYNIGDKLCQLIIVPAPEFELEEVDELSYTERGAKGHGEADNVIINSTTCESSRAF